MKTSDFFFELPEHLIAQHPPAERGQSRLMVLNGAAGREHRMVRDLPSLLEKGTLLVFNNSRVRKARLLGTAESGGGQAEFLLLKKRDPLCWQVMANRSRRRRIGSRYIFADGTTAEIVPSEKNAENGADAAAPTADTGNGFFKVLRFDRPIDDEWLDQYGHIPLPPYIRRADTCSDAGRYQTVYADITGSAAAPTAGLHFTRELLEELQKAGMETVFITLHVGLGTFLPVRTENVEDHLMHEETYCIGEDAAAAIEKARAEGRKILAVGTTSLRTLESAWRDDAENPAGGGLKRGEGTTSIFMYPGYQFRAADMLFTNFHTPLSTLLMLVSAFAGRERILESYREAVQEGYRFFSYGDAMLIRP